MDLEETCASDVLWSDYRTPIIQVENALIDAYAGNFSRSNIEFAISQPKMVRLPWNKKQTYQLNQASNVTNGFDQSRQEFSLANLPFQMELGCGQ